jgi:hypothetical protein
MPNSSGQNPAQELPEQNGDTNSVSILIHIFFEITADLAPVTIPASDTGNSSAGTWWAAPIVIIWFLGQMVIWTILEGLKGIACLGIHILAVVLQMMATFSLPR